MNERRKIRILCVDDHSLVIDGLASRIGLERDLEFVGDARSAEEMIRMVAETRPHVVLLDIEMPGEDPFVMIEILNAQQKPPRAIMLSAFVRDHYIDASIDKGAWGYFSKSDPPDAVMQGVRDVHAGLTAFGPRVRERIQRDVSRAGDGTQSSRLHLLSPREREVLRLIGKGMSRADIAHTLHRSRKTIDTHHTSIMRKLDIHDRVEVALYAVREGLAES